MVEVNIQTGLSSILVLLITSLLYFSSCSKTNECSYLESYYQEVYQAELAFYKGEHEIVYDILSNVEIHCPLLNQPGIYEQYKFAQSAARLGHDVKSLELIRELVLRKGYTLTPFQDNDAFVSLMNQEGWQSIESNYDELRKQYLGSIRLDIRAEIHEMVAADQYHRNLLNRASMNPDSLWIIINHTDSINDAKLKNIIESVGYPDYRIIGNYNVDMQHVDPGILLFHIDDFDYYAYKLIELIDQGLAPPTSLGNFVDSYQRSSPETKKFIYGIYDNVGEDQIIEHDKLDERRKAIGLAPMDLKREIQVAKDKYYSE